MACEARMEPTEDVEVDKTLRSANGTLSTNATAERAEALADEQRAQKKLVTAKAELKTAESRAESAPNVATNVAKLHKAQETVAVDEKMVVDSEARAALAGKDQRELERAQENAQVKADEAEQAKSEQYKSTNRM